MRITFVLLCVGRVYGCILQISHNIFMDLKLALLQFWFVYLVKIKVAAKVSKTYIPVLSTIRYVLH